ncbi:DUF1993 domain-containing protein [Bradyrhizobium tropiciagri]|uniref:DUF1993 domain-containing protein n=1 Tax=Bradyrhizobium tropiciagri TaxID=312253 RepID=UPI001BA5504E|nr:DUF1993 domain-containing protein [Bradyrhizobium tropiciagri]MBR0895665.1 DUF1993 domain-containing protein [Bradyrhizobium tropiciagri]
MTAPFYDASVPVFRQMLESLADLLRKGEAHARERGLDPDAMLAARLAPDMLTLVGQVQRASDHAKGAAGRLAGLEPPTFVDDERSLAEAHARISRTLDYIDTVPVQTFARAADRIITLPFGVPPMSAARYLYGFALPSLFFHVATAYAILRHRGVPLGKRDFLGNYLSN